MISWFLNRPSSRPLKCVTFLSEHQSLWQERTGSSLERWELHYNVYNCALTAAASVWQEKKITSSLCVLIYLRCILLFGAWNFVEAQLQQYLPLLFPWSGWHADPCVQLQYLGAGTHVWSPLWLHPMHCCSSDSALHSNQQWSVWKLMMT